MEFTGPEAEGKTETHVDILNVCFGLFYNIDLAATDITVADSLWTSYMQNQSVNLQHI